MFQRALIFPEKLNSYRLEIGSQIDLGRLAETLVFYDEVYVLAEPSVLINLITGIGGDVFIELLKQGRLRIHAVHASPHRRLTTGIKESIFDLPSWGRGISSLDEKLLEYALKIDPWCFSDTAVGRSDIAKAIDAMLTLSFDIVEPIQRSIKLLSEQAVTDESFLRRILGAVLNPAPFDAKFDTFEIERASTYDEEDAAFRIIQKTTAPMRNKIDMLGTEVISGGRTTDCAVLEACALLYRIAIVPALNAELSANPALTTAMTQAIEESIVRRSPYEQIASFQQYVFDDATAIRNVFARGNKDFFEMHAAYRDLITVLGRRDRFSTWLNDREPGADLVREYLEYAYRGTSLERIPGRICRLFVFTGASTVLGTLTAGGAGMAIGAAASFGFGAFDAFVFDRIAQHWRPHQFSEGPFKEFGGPLKKFVEEGQAAS